MTTKEQLIEKHKSVRHPISWFLDALGMSSKTWYGSEHDDESDYWIRDLLIMPVLEDMPFYGYRKVHRQLRRDGWKINKKRIQRIMQKFNLMKTIKKRKVTTTNSRHGLYKYPNLIRDIVPSHPNQIWAADITYIFLANGVCYLASLIDVFTKKIRGWAIMSTLSEELILAALESALLNNPPPQYHHSDRGSQYCGIAYTGKLKAADIQISMSETGEHTQNPYAESFFRTLKVEEVYLKEYQDMADARKHITEFIEAVYTTKRLHASLNYQTPEEFEDAWTLSTNRVSLKSINIGIDKDGLAVVS